MRFLSSPRRLGACLLMLLATGSSASTYWVRSLTGVKEAFHLMQQAIHLGAKKRPPTKLEVVNVGIGRTGTTSFIAALKELGYTPIHDNNFGEVADLFAAIFDPNESMTPAQWAHQAGARGFDVMGSGVMLPYEFVEWAAQQDDVKIILTLRDNPRKWVESFLSVQYAIEIFESRPFIWLTGIRQVYPALDHAFRTVCTNYKPDMDKNVDTLMEGYEEHLRRIRKIVPGHKLLEFNVKQGWEPLCTFLDKPIPDTKFPHVNDRVVMRTLLGTLWVITWTWPLLGLLILYLVWLAARPGLRLLVDGGGKKENNDIADEIKKHR